jgi:uncharacterized protein YjbJ (UPF0337 family)
MGKHFDKASGKGKETLGKLTGDKGEQADGKLDQAKGDAKGAADQAMDEAGELKDKAAGRIKDVFER